MKVFVALCLFGAVFGAPQFRDDSDERRFVSDEEPIRILRMDVSPIDGPNFQYAFETENGITEERQGSEGSVGQSVYRGSFSYPLPDGTIAQYTYVADEGGYNVESDLIPTPHPMPAHALEQIRIAEELRAQGVEWDEQGFRI